MYYFPSPWQRINVLSDNDNEINFIIQPVQIVRFWFMWIYRLDINQSWESAWVMSLTVPWCALLSNHDKPSSVHHYGNTTCNNIQHNYQLPWLPANIGRNQCPNLLLNWILDVQSMYYCRPVCSNSRVGSSRLKARVLVSKSQWCSYTHAKQCWAYSIV